jgi:osmotically-inducible protein OsmY
VAAVRRASNDERRGLRSALEAEHVPLNHHRKVAPMATRVPDKTILQKVTQRLSRTGTGSRDKITATIRSGDVTLTGSLSYEHQRREIVNAARAVEGVRRVIDQLQVAPRKKSWQ